MHKPTIIILFLILISIFTFQSSSAQKSVQIAIYNGEGTWAEGITALQHFFDWKGISHDTIGHTTINTINLSNYYDAILFPGGYAFNYKIKINASGRQNIKSLINNGGGYIGICAGAFFASDSVEWEGVKYNYPLDLFDGIAFGAIASIAAWPGYNMTSLVMNAGNPINQFGTSTQTMLYYGGPAFFPHTNVDIDTVATWGDYNNDNAIINFSYGQGRVLLVGPHPEIEEDSNRDGTSFAGDLDDNGSDWGFLWSATDWVLGQTISDSTGITTITTNDIFATEATTLSQNQPNPFNTSTTISFYISKKSKIEISVYNISGEKVKTLTCSDLNIGKYSVVWNGTEESGNCVDPGIYVYKLNINGKVASAKKCLLINE